MTDLYLELASRRVQFAERQLTNAIETRGVAVARIAWLRSELERARRARADLMMIPAAPSGSFRIASDAA